MYDFEGIHDYNTDETSTLNGEISLNEDDSISPLRDSEKVSQAKSLSSFKKSAGKSILRTTSRFGAPQIPLIIPKDDPRILRLSSSSCSDEMQLEDFS